MRFLSILFILQIFTIQSFSQYNLIQQIDPPSSVNLSANNFAIPFQKYKFTNDLTLIINEDHSEPLVSVQFMFKMGSAACNADMTGMMNLIYLSLYDNEKSADMMWMRKNGLVFKSKLTKDFMTFQMTAPKHLYQQAFWYQAKKLTEFVNNLNLNDFTSAKEKAIKQVIDSNSTYSAMGFDLSIKSLYPFGHPYSWPTYGFVSHYDIIGINELKKFYSEWFGPNNLIISVSGDIGNSDVLTITDNYFKNMPKAINSYEKVANSILSLPSIENPKANSNRYSSVVVENENFTKPILYMIYNGVSFSTKSHYELDCAADLLGNSEYGMLKQILTELEIAENVSVTNYSLNHGGYFVIKVVATQNYPLALLKDTIDYFVSNAFSVLDKQERNAMKQQIQTIKEDGTVYEFNIDNPHMFINFQMPKYSAKQLTNMFSGIESTAKKAYYLAKNELYMNNPAQINVEYQNFFELNPSRLTKTSTIYLSDALPLVVSILPLDQAKYKPAPDNYSSIDLQTVISPVSDEEIAKLSIASFNEKMPKAGKTTPFVAPNKTMNVLENGLKYSITQNTESPLIDILIATDISSIRKIAAVNEAPGLLVELVKEKILKAMNGQMKEQIDLGGINYNIFVKDDVLYFRFELINEYMHFMKEIIRELIVSQNPVPGIDFEKIIIRFRDLEKNPEVKDIGKNLLFVQSNNTNSMPRQDMSNMKHFLSFYMLRINDNYARILDPAKTTVTVFGNYKEGEISDFKEVFRQWNTISSPVIPDNVAPTDSIKFQPACYLVNYPNAKNYQVLYVASTLDNKDFSGKIKLDFLKFLNSDMYNNLFSFESAINDYFGKVKSGYFSYQKNLLFYYSTGIKENNFILGLKEFEKLVYQSPMELLDKKTFKALKNNFISSDHLVYEKNSSKAFLVNQSVANDIPSDYFVSKAKALKKLKPSTLKSFSDTEAAKNKGMIIIVGNIEKVINDIKSAGYTPIIETDRNGFTDTK